MRVLLIVKNLLLIAGSLITGLIQGALFFSDYATGESVVTRFVLSASLAIFSGLIIGYNFRRYWWSALISVWALTILLLGGVFNISLNLRNIAELVILIIPIMLVLISSYWGYALYQEQNTKVLFISLLFWVFVFTIVAFVYPHFA